MKIIYINIIALKSVKSFKNKCLDNYLKSQERERVSKKHLHFLKTTCSALISISNGCILQFYFKIMFLRNF